MANKNLPFGFIPIRTEGSMSSTSQRYPIKNGYGTSGNFYLGKNGFCKLNAGYVEDAAAGDQNIWALVTGVEFDTTAALKLKDRRVAWPGNTVAPNGTSGTGRGGYCWVKRDLRDQEFLVQCDAAVSEDDIGEYADLVVGSRSDDRVGQWGDNSKIGTPSSSKAQFVIVNLYDEPTNEKNSAYNKVIVKLAEGALIGNL